MGRLAGLGGGSWTVVSECAGNSAKASVHRVRDPLEHPRRCSIIFIKAMFRGSYSPGGSRDPRMNERAGEVNGTPP